MELCFVIVRKCQMMFHWKIAPLFLLILYSHADFPRAQAPETTTDYPTSVGAFCTESDYSPWSQWSTCSVTCGLGSRSRSRDCNGAMIEGTENCTMPSCANYTDPRQGFECSTGIEVSFLIDTSGSVGIDNFKKVQQFTKDVTTELKSGYERLNLTIITFNNEAKISLSMNESSKLEELLNAEGNLTYTHGGTETHKALQLLHQFVVRNDTSSPQVAIVVTDGSSWHPKLTKQWAEQLKKLGIVIYVVGVGDDFNPYELSAISSDPDEKYFFRLNNYNELSSLIGVFSHKQCPVTTTMQPTTPTTPTTTEYTTTTELPTTTTTIPTTTKTTEPITTTVTELPTTTSTTTTTTTIPTTTKTTEPITTTVTELPTTTTSTTVKPTSITTQPTTTESTTATTSTAKSTTDAAFPTTTITPLPNETPSQTTGSTKAPMPVSALTPTGRPATASTETPTQRPNIVTLGRSETLAPPTQLPTDSSTETAPLTSEAMTSKVTQPSTTIWSTTTQTPQTKSTSTQMETTTTTKEPIQTTEITTSTQQETTTTTKAQDSTSEATTTTQLPESSTTTTTKATPTTTTESVTTAESTSTRPETTTTAQLPETMIVTKERQTTTATILLETTSSAREQLTTVTTTENAPQTTRTMRSQDTTTSPSLPKLLTTSKQVERTTPDNEEHTTEASTTVPVPEPTTEAALEETTTTQAPVTVRQTESSTLTSTFLNTMPLTTSTITTTRNVQDTTTTLPQQESSATTTTLPTSEVPLTTQFNSLTTSTTPPPVILTAKRSTTRVPTTTTPAGTTIEGTVPETAVTEPHTTVTDEPAETTSSEPLSTTTPSCIAKFADVVIVVDSSGSIGRPNFEKIKEFIKDVVLTFDVDYRYTRVGLIEFSTTPRIEFKLNENTNITDLIDAIDNITYSGGGTSTSDALELMRIEGFDRERPLAPDIAIVITDGLSKFPQLTRVQAQIAKAEGIAIFSIGIGNETSTAELQAIASSPSYVFEVGDYQTLFTLDGVVAHRACGVVLPEEYHTRSSTPSTTARTGCFDIDAQCPSYPRDSCTDFEPFARKNCPRKCGFCPGFPLLEPPCEDNITDCQTYGTGICSSTSQYEWADAHCRKFCGFCGNKTDIISTTTTAPVTTVSTVATCSDLLPNCSKYGGPSMCQTYGDWAKARCAKYCEFCFNYTTVPSVMVNNVICPKWKLPDVCTLDKSDGNCCPMPKCPDNIVLTVKRH